MSWPNGPSAMGHGDPVEDLDVADPGGHRAAERVGQPDPDLEVAGVGGVVAEQHEVVRAPLRLVVADHGRDLGGHVARSVAGRVGDDVGRGRAAQRQRGAQLVGGLGRAEGQHGRLSPGRGRDLHGQLHGAQLVVADREADVPAVDPLAVRGQQHLARGVRHPLQADEDVGHDLIRSLSGSKSGVASIEPTVTG